MKTEKDIILIMGDTHDDSANAIPHIIKKAIEKGAKSIIHTGDIEPKHLNAELFGNLPVVCALIKGQSELPEFCYLPNGWRITKPGDRVLSVKNNKYYVGHQRAFELLCNSEITFRQTLNTMRRDHDGIRFLFSGHTHHQTFIQDPLLSFVNPGAVTYSHNGHEYAFLDTKTGETTFTRILKTKPTIETFKIGIISDSNRIAEMDPTFWGKLAKEFKKREVNTIIHCGNFDSSNPPIKEFEELKIYYNLRPKQPEVSAKGWEKIKDPLIMINNYGFCIQLDFGAKILRMSEPEMENDCVDFRVAYPGTNFIICGSSENALLSENGVGTIINPGSIETRKFVTLELPKKEIVFGSIPFDPLAL